MTETVNAPAHAGRYLTFSVADEVYGLDILRVQEIVGMIPLTRVPRLPDSVAGVVNLRGRIIPVLELRRSLGLPPVIHSERTCIIIVRSEIDSVTRVTGLIVDGVSDVVDLARHDIEDTPEFGQAIETPYLSGIGRHEERILLLLDIDTILANCTVNVADIDQTPAA